ncbi:MAG: hypothetical protein LBF50_02560 [Azoarcus sp.]|nr:hypothetical protein [Azoarcus sp.]
MATGNFFPAARRAARGDAPLLPRLVLLLALFLFLLPLRSGAARAAEDAPPGCPAGSGDCGLSASGLAPFDAIVVGHPLKVLSDDEMRALYRWAKTRMWKDFPDDEADYLARNRVMLLPVDAEGRRAVFVHMAVTDYIPEVYLPGALIRYTPRAMPESYYPDGRPIHSVLAGCAGVMCTAGDAACLGDYPQGTFRFNDGIELDPRTREPLAHGRHIDPISMRERAAEMREQRKQSQQAQQQQQQQQQRQR